MKNSKTTKLLLASVPLSLIGLTSYVNLKENRSLRSWTIEKLFKVLNIKQYFEKKSPQEFQEQLDEARIVNAKKYPSPEKWIHTSVKDIDYQGMQTFIWNDKHDSAQKTILYIHGGAYIKQPLSLHFKAINEIAQKIDARVVFPIYPQLPDNNYQAALSLISSLYCALLARTHSENITIMGDSAGGGLSLSLALYLADHKIAQPSNIILLSPWLDIKTSNPDIKSLEAKDPMLSAWGLNKLGKLWSKDERNMNNPYVSPLFGKDFTGLGKISIFVGTHEIFLPDCRLLHEKLKQENVEHNFVVGPKMNHVYPVYPIPEAKKAREQIVKIIADSVEK